MIRRSIRAAITLFFLGGLIVAAQPGSLGERLPVRTYTIDDGLPSDSVRGIVRDSAGYLWLLTEEGLCRFDGQFFTLFGTNLGLPEGRPRAFLETRDGLLLVGFEDGVYWHDPSVPGADPMFRAARPVATGEGNIVTTFYEDGEGRLWCGTVRGLFRMERTSDGWSFTWVDMGKPPDDVVRNRVYQLVQDRFGALWVLTSAGLVWLRGDGSVEVLTERDGLPHYALQGMVADAEDRIWIGSWGGIALMEPDPASGRPVVLRTYGREEGLVEPSGLIPTIWDMVWSSEGRLWAGTRGLVRIDPAGGPGGFRLFGVENGLSSPHVMSLAEDLAGNLWAGTAESGVMRIARTGLVSYAEEDGLRVSRPRALLQEDEGPLMVVGTGSHNVYIFDGERFTEVRPLLPEGIADLGWGGTQIDFRDSHGEWWFGTFGGLVRFPPVRSVEELATTPPAAHYTTGNGLLADGVFRVYEDSRGDLWIGTMDYVVRNRSGLQRWDRATERFQTFGGPDGVPRDTPSAFLEDPAGNLWVGFYNRGAGRFRDGRFTLFSGAKGAPEGYISQFHVDRAGRLWIATERCGLVLVEDPDAEVPTFVSYGRAEGLCTDSFTCVTEDDRGRLYAGSNLGLDRFDPRTGRVRHYSRKDGLIDNRVDLAFRDREGRLWFGTSLGLSRLNPDDDDTTREPTVYLRELHAAGGRREISPFGERSVSGLELPWGQRQLEVQFSGMSLSPSQELRFQYVLRGAQAEWSPPTTDRTVRFAGLAPGRYRFQVRAVGEEGAVSSVPASVSFRVLPPFWRSWWFVSAMLILAAAVAYAFHRVRLRRALELERVRTRIATDLHDDIGSSLSQVSILSEVVRRQVADAYPGAAAALAQIAETARHLVDSMSDIVWAINPKRDRAADLVQRMRRFASDTFTARAIALRFDAGPDGHDRRLEVELRRQVYLIFKEAVNNAVRHSGCSRAEVRLHVDNRRLELVVADDGQGFDLRRPGDGHGLASMRERAAGLGGTLSLESGGGAGTTVRLRVPLRG